MSNPVTNVEIEDVLSSIRRLVAEGDKSGDAMTAADAAPAPQAERFVLTPALRVAETAPAPEEPELSAASQELAAQFVAPAAEPLLLEPTLAADAPLLHDAMSDEDRASLEATIAELEAAVTDPSDEWELDGSEMGETRAPSSLVEMFRAVDDGDVVEHDDIEEVDDADTPNDAEVVALHRQPEPTFRHAAVDATPDADYGDELAVDDEADGMPIPDDLDESIAAYLAGGSRIDQDMLRDMITQVVREELKGEMGERITRNIRKLVRREIANALSSKTIS